MKLTMQQLSPKDQGTMEEQPSDTELGQCTASQRIPLKKRVARRKHHTGKHCILKHQGSSPLGRKWNHLFCSVASTRFIRSESVAHIIIIKTLLPRTLRSPASRVQEEWPRESSELCAFPQDFDATTTSVGQGIARASSRGEKFVCVLILRWLSLFSNSLTEVSGMKSI